jgi:TadE-like protein
MWRSANRKGSVLLETGLALPVLALLLLGGMDFGQFMVARQALVAGARAGAQVVALNPEAFKEEQVRQAVEADNPGVVKRVTLHQLTRCALEDGSDGGPGTCAEPRRYLQVKVETDAAGMFGMPRQHLEASAFVRLP